MKIKTSELEKQALDWAVAVCLGHKDIITDFGVYIRIKTHPAGALTFCPSTDWALGGPIIERERIELEWSGSEWWARIKADEDFSAPTPLVAAMRCYVASKLGDEVDVPDELVEGEK